MTIIVTRNICDGVIDTDYCEGNYCYWKLRWGSLLLEIVMILLLPGMVIGALLFEIVMVIVTGNYDDDLCYRKL